MGAHRGYNIDMFEADYNQVEQQVMDPTSDLYKHNAKYNIFFQSTHKLLEKYSLLPAAEWGYLAEERLAFVRTICETVPGKIIYYNYPEIGDAVFGSYENKVPSSFIYQVRKIDKGKNDWATIIENKCEEKDIPFYDFEQDSVFLSHPEWFYNTIHLNDMGAKEYTKKVVNVISNYLEHNK